MHSKKKKKNGCFQIFRLSNNRIQDSSDPGPDFTSLGIRKNITTLCRQLGRSHVSPCRQLLVYHIKAHLAAFNHLQ